MSVVLVTGGGGFVGTQIVRQLVKNGHSLRLVARPSTAERLAQLWPQASVIECDNVFAQSAGWWADKLAGVDALIHAAWYVNPEDYLDSHLNAACVSGSFAMAQGAVTAGVHHVIGLGTCMEYALPGENLSVDSPTGPVTVYGASKLALLEILDGVFKPADIIFSWCRLFYLYGEGENAKRLYPYLKQCFETGTPAQLGPGTQLRDYLDVTLAGAAIADVVDTGQNGIINICSGQAVSIRQFAEDIADQYGRRDLLSFGSYKPHPRDPAAVVGVPNFTARQAGEDGSP